MLGAGTVLLPADGARKLKSLKGSEQQVLALLSAAYGAAVAPTVLGNIERAAKCWARATITPPTFIWRTLGCVHSTISRTRPIACGRQRVCWITAARRAPCLKRCVLIRVTSTRWKNASIPTSLVCPPDIPTAASGQAEIGPARQMRPAELYPMRRRTTRGSLAHKTRPTNRRNLASATIRARRSSRHQRSPRLAGVEHVALLGFYQSRGTMAWQGRLEAAPARRDSGRHRDRSGGRLGIFFWQRRLLIGPIRLTPILNRTSILPRRLKSCEKMRNLVTTITISLSGGQKRMAFRRVGSNRLTTSFPSRS